MSTDPFDPQSNYQAPKGNSNYLKFEKGHTEFLPLASAIVGWQYWNTENRPVRLKDQPTGNYADLKGIRQEEDGKYSVKHFWAFPVIDVADGRVKILEVTQSSVQQAIRAYTTNPRWGSPVMKYTLTVNREGDGFNTEYTVMANPAGDIPKAWEAAWKDAVSAGFDITALFSGADPFTANAEV